MPPSQGRFCTTSNDLHYFHRRASAGQCENVIQVAKFICPVMCFAIKMMEFKKIVSRTHWAEAPRPKFLRGLGRALISDTISTPKPKIMLTTYVRTYVCLNVRVGICLM